MSVDEAPGVRPVIHLVESEADLLAELAVGLETRAPDLARLLFDEIDRAEIVDEASLPPDTVRIGSRVEFLNEENGRTHEVKLVLPGEADIASGAISVLTPTGAGLIGLSTGQTIRWPDSSGVDRVLRVTKVTAP